MLDMGFMPDVRRIIDQCPRERQTLLFSATMPPEIARLTDWALHEPEQIEIGARRSPAETITHALYPVAAAQKFDLLVELLKKTNFDSVAHFRPHQACRRPDRHSSRQRNIRSPCSTRTAPRTSGIEALEGFRNGKYEVMVATDIASRGIDVAGVSHVINYDVPQHHRGLCPSHRPHRPRPGRRRRLHPHDRRGMSRLPPSNVLSANRSRA